MSKHVINYLFSFSRIKVLHNLIVARQQSVKILQIQSKKISKADRIKKLNFENKHLFGSKIKEKEVAAVEPVDVENLSSKDISSEIYWTCLHVPEVQDFTKVSKPAKVKETGKKQKKTLEVAVEQDEAKPKVKVATEKKSKKVPEVKIERNFKKEPRKTVIIPDVLLPSSLANLEKNLPSIKGEIKDKLLTNFKLRPMESETRNGPEQEIPFDSPQLREIPNFPMVLSKLNRIVTEFDKFVPKDSSILKPSVSKVLQATMPDNQRAALMHWKQLKISELGLEGFELMQKCKLQIT